MWLITGSVFVASLMLAVAIAVKCAIDCMRFANLLKLELQTLIEENGNLKIANAELRMDLDDADDATAMYIRRINGN